MPFMWLAFAYNGLPFFVVYTLNFIYLFYRPCDGYVTNVLVSFLALGIFVICFVGFDFQCLPIRVYPPRRFCWVHHCLISFALFCFRDASSFAGDLTLWDTVMVTSMVST